MSCVKPATIKLIILLMCISLLGIVFVQVYWIMNAVRVSEERFDRDVNEALNELVAKIETQETSRMITTNLIAMTPDHSDSTCISGSEMHFKIKTPDENYEIDPHVIIDSISNGLSSDLEQRIIISGLDDIENSLHNIETIMTLKEDSIRNICISLEQENKLALKTEKFKEVVERMVMEFEIKEMSLEQRLDEMDFPEMLHGALSQRALDLPYEYQVSGSSTTGAVMESTGYTEGHRGQAYQVNLFPNDIVEKPDKLNLYFPGKSGYIYSSLWLMMTGSGVFTLIILLTFIFTILAIIRQKRLADIKNDFINNMTHEFKTPIATISLASDSISSPLVIEDKEMVKYFSGVIKEESMRMNANVERVLQLSLLEREKRQFNIKDVELHAMIGQAMDKIRLQLDQREGVISSSLQAAATVVKADPDHLVGVWLNLFDNAMKYSPGKPEISISSYDREGNICIEISDKGIGLAKEDLKKIFDRFHRVHTGDVHNVKGFGLGLSYVKEVVTAFGGTVTVQSKKGEGSIFTVCLPLVK